MADGSMNDAQLTLHQRIQLHKSAQYRRGRFDFIQDDFPPKLLPALPPGPGLGPVPSLGTALQDALLRHSRAVNARRLGPRADVGGNEFLGRDGQRTIALVRQDVLKFAADVWNIRT